MMDALVLSAVLAFIVSFAFCWYKKEQAKSVRFGDEAGGYVESGSLEITYRRDRYTHTTTTRRRIERKKSPGGPPQGPGGHRMGRF